mgnify:CR=1 FL=1
MIFCAKNLVAEQGGSICKPRATADILRHINWPFPGHDAIERFRSGRSKVLVLSVAAGAGLDGLQHCCRTVVIGELTWTEEEINQCIGRVDRDGQEHPVTAYILTSDAGLDPSMLARARLKGEQSAGLLADDAVRQFAERFIGKARSA